VSRFLDLLDLEVMRDPQGRPLLTRQGRQLFRVLSRFRYQSDVVAAYRRSAGIPEPEPAIPGLVETKAGTVTYLCSQPQLTMSMLGEIAQDESVPHDQVYSDHCVPREIADKMLYEACLLMGRPRWKALLIYAAVRIGGGMHWSPAAAAAPAAGPTPVPPLLPARR
jgi:hypothetical protein